MLRPALLHRRLSYAPPRCFPCAGSRRWLGDLRTIHEPLRILFCGADEFSIYSLQAIHELQKHKPESIASIDVVCRPDKRVGRGLKQIQEVPVKSTATELKLPIHQIDTFTGWTPPSPIDLVVAVSFGLLVPARILKGTTYGGLNVHPSLLPDFRGPAPIQHALLQGRSITGVTLQTMHPDKFDHGMIVAQQSTPVPKDATPDHLVHQLGPIGAEMLRKTVEKRVFVSPKNVANVVSAEDTFMHAPKIKPEDRHIDWTTWDADRLMRYDRVLGRLWDTTTYQRCFLPHKNPSKKRVTFHGPWTKLPGLEGQTVTPGYPMQYRPEGSKTALFAVCAADGVLLTPDAATIEGEQKGRALQALLQALKMAGNR